jgi:hypothetical protein
MCKESGSQERMCKHSDELRKKRKSLNACKSLIPTTSKHLNNGEKWGPNENFY